MKILFNLRPADCLMTLLILTIIITSFTCTGLYFVEPWIPLSTQTHTDSIKITFEEA